jgi:small subunit ribosomal protein S21
MKGYFLQVLVRDNNVDQAPRVRKKQMQRGGIFREMKRRRFYEKPSDRSAREEKRVFAASTQVRSQEGPTRGTSSRSPRQEGG